MTTIRENDFIQSVADALQYISDYHPVDYIEHLGRAYDREQSPAAKDAIAQILTNSRMCAEGRRPICQDTGIVNVFLKVGMNVRFDTRLSLAELTGEGVRRAYEHPDNRLRASAVDDPLFARRNTRDNTPAVLHVELVPGDTVDVTVAAKGGGSENKSKFVMLNPSDSLADWVLRTVPAMGAGWCPPGMLGVGVGGTAEKAMLLATESLMGPIDMHELLERGPRDPLEELRIELYEKVNALGIGAQGLGGLTTVLGVKIKSYPTHAASKPVAMIPNCAATRHAHFVLDGTGPVALDPPALEAWPRVTWSAGPASRRVNLDALTREEVSSWKPGETLLLSGRMLTGRDAAHKRIADLFASGAGLPEGVDFTNRVIYYVRPVDPVRDEVWARRVRPPRLGWTSSRSSCSSAPACSRWWARRSAGRTRSSRSAGTAPRISWRSAARGVSRFPRPYAPPVSWHSPILVWRRFTNSWSGTCPSPLRSTHAASPCTRPGRRNGARVSARSAYRYGSHEQRCRQ